MAPKDGKPDLYAVPSDGKAKKPVRKSRKAPPKSTSTVDLYDLGARVVSVFKGTVMIAMPLETAVGVFPEPLDKSARTSVVEAAEKDIAAVRKRDKDLAGS